MTFVHWFTILLYHIFLNIVCWLHIHIHNKPSYRPSQDLDSLWYNLYEDLEKSSRGRGLPGVSGGWWPSSCSTHTSTRTSLWQNAYGFYLWCEIGTIDKNAHYCLRQHVIWVLISIMNFRMRVFFFWVVIAQFEFSMQCLVEWWEH